MCAVAGCMIERGRGSVRWLNMVDILPVHRLVCARFDLSLTWDGDDRRHVLTPQRCVDIRRGGACSDSRSDLLSSIIWRLHL